MKNTIFSVLLLLSLPCSSYAISKENHMKMNAEKRYEFYAELFKKVDSGKGMQELNAAIPGFGKNIAAAIKVSQSRWADSVNYDELAKAEIVPVSMLKKMGIPFYTDEGIVHVTAGAMHTYGYVLSQLKTAYGLKGKRWIESRIDERLGLPAGTFSPFAKEGEFLTNLTAKLDLLGGEHALIENVKWKNDKNEEQSAAIETAFVRLKPIAGYETTDTTLLIYRLKCNWKTGVQLVTAFPVNDAFVAGVKDGSKKLTAENFKARYNLYINPKWKVSGYSNDWH